MPPGIKTPLGQKNLFSQLIPYDVNLKIWYYLDDQGKVQGKFSSKEMDEWNEEGFFYPTLMIAYEIADTMDDFVPLVVYESHPGIFLQLKFTRMHRP